MCGHILYCDKATEVALEMAGVRDSFEKSEVLPLYSGLTFEGSRCMQGKKGSKGPMSSLTACGKSGVQGDP